MLTTGMDESTQEAEAGLQRRDGADRRTDRCLYSLHTHALLVWVTQTLPPSEDHILDIIHRVTVTSLVTEVREGSEVPDVVDLLLQRQPWWCQWFLFKNKKGKGKWLGAGWTWLRLTLCGSVHWGQRHEDAQKEDFEVKCHSEVKNFQWRVNHTGQRKLYVLYILILGTEK